MSTVIVIEIIAAILVLAAVVLYAVRDTQQRSAANPQEQYAPEDAPEAPAHGGEVQAEQPVSEGADRS